MYKGYMDLTLGDDDLAKFYGNRADYIPQSSFLENEYLVIKNYSGQIVDKYKFQDKELKKLQYKCSKSTYMGTIKPLNFEQELALDLLDDDSITVKLVRGVYGAGKDYLMLSKSLELLEKGKYERIIYIRPNVTVKDVPDIGYLPSGVYDKLSWTLGPLFDKVGGEEGVRQMIEQGKLELMPLLFIRGRSFQNSIVYVSEGQNITTEIAKLLLGRIGEGSVMMINADNHQTDRRAYENDNGILSMIERLSGNRLFGYVYLGETLRSQTANLANLLD